MPKTELQTAKMNAVFHKKQMEYHLEEIEILTGKKTTPPKKKGFDWDKAYDNLFGT